MGNTAVRARLCPTISQPGKPTENAYIKSFNGKLKDEFSIASYYVNSRAIA